MIEKEAIMTARENAHQLIDTLSEDHLADVLDYLADLNDTDEISDQRLTSNGQRIANSE